MRNPCKECDYYHKENNTCQSKKCCTGGDGYITWIDRLFCKPYKYNIVINNYFKSECNVNTSIREAFEKGFRIGVKKGLAQSKADAPQTDEFFREPTAEERKAVADYIDSISVPTGVNIFDLMDEHTELPKQIRTPYEGDIKVTPQRECRTCKWAEVSWTSHYCDDCKAYNKYEPNDTPQTDYYDYGKSEMENIKLGNGISREIPQTERNE